MKGYRFLFDRDAAKAAELFPAPRVLGLKDVGLPENAKDSEIFKVACERQLTVVTCNGDDFVREFKSHLGQTKKTDCHDMYGLVILPNGFEIQRRVVPKLASKLRLNAKPMTWRDVWDKDCCVKVSKNGTVAVSRFPRCHYCKKGGLD